MVFLQNVFQRFEIIHCVWGVEKGIDLFRHPTRNVLSQIVENVLQKNHQNRKILPGIPRSELGFSTEPDKINFINRACTSREDDRFFIARRVKRIV